MDQNTGSALRIKVDYKEPFCQRGWLEVFAQEFSIEGVTGHRFAVHNSVSRYGEYTATHIETGFAIGSARTPEAVIELARERWLHASPEEIAAKLERAKSMTGLAMGRAQTDPLSDEGTIWPEFVSAPIASQAKVAAEQSDLQQRINAELGAAFKDDPANACRAHAAITAALRAAPAGSVDAGGAVPAGWKRSEGSARASGWAWDYDWLQSLLAQVQAKGWDTSMETIDALLSILAAAPVPPAAPAEPQIPSSMEVLTAEAKLYRDLTGDAVALGYEGLADAVEALRKSKAAPAERSTSQAWPKPETVREILQWISEMSDDKPICDMAKAGLEALAIQSAAPSEQQSAPQVMPQGEYRWYSMDGKQHDTGRVVNADGGFLASTGSPEDAKLIADALNAAAPTAQQSTQAERAVSEDRQAQLLRNDLEVVESCMEDCEPSDQQSFRNLRAVVIAALSAKQSAQPRGKADGAAASVFGIMAEETRKELRPALEIMSAAPAAQEVEQPHTAGAARQGGDTCESIDCDAFWAILRAWAEAGGAATDEQVRAIPAFITDWSDRRVAVARRVAERALREATMLLRPLVQDGVEIKIKDARQALAKLDSAIRSTAADSQRTPAAPSADQEGN